MSIKTTSTLRPHAKQNLYRPPTRIEPTLPSGTNEIPGPPESDKGSGSLLQQAFLPMVMIFGYILTSMFGGGRNILMMIPMLLSVVATVVLAFTPMPGKEKDRRGRGRLQARHQRTAPQDGSDHEEQRIYYYYNYPNPEKTLGIASDLTRAAGAHQEDIRSGTRLWERRPRIMTSCTCGWASARANPR